MKSLFHGRNAVNLIKVMEIKDNALRPAEAG
jgi:hypothetical protein